MSKCVFPECPKKVEHRHHIVYVPEVIVGLCRGHHEDITIVNVNATEKTRRKLSNDQRWDLWRQWLAGAIQPIRTENALAWIAKWDRPRRKKWFRKIKLHEVIVANSKKGLVVIKASDGEEFAVNPIFVSFIQKCDDTYSRVIMADKNSFLAEESFNSLVERLGK